MVAKKKAMKLPLVTIGIPTRNRPVGLDRTLNKMRSQTYKNLEIIVSDNASEVTQVAEICEKHCREDSRVRSIRQESNIGVYNNCWALLNQAKAEYFLFAADDDDWPCDYVELLLKKLMITNCSIAVGNLITGTTLDSENSISDEKLIYNLFAFYEEPERISRMRLYLKHSYCLECQMFYGLTLTSMMREAFSKVREIYNSPLDMDLFIIFYIVTVGPICIEPRTFRVATLHPNSTTNQYLTTITLNNGVAEKRKRLLLLIDLCNTTNGLSDSERNEINKMLKAKISHLPLSAFIQAARTGSVYFLKSLRLHGFYRGMKEVISRILNN